MKQPCVMKRRWCSYTDTGVDAEYVRALLVRSGKGQPQGLGTALTLKALVWVLIEDTRVTPLSPQRVHHLCLTGLVIKSVLFCLFFSFKNHSAFFTLPWDFQTFHHTPHGVLVSPTFWKQGIG